MANILDLTGKYFHTIEGAGKIIEQGFVLGVITPDIYLVQFFSWTDGRPTIQKTVAVEDMAKWNFYDDQSEWSEAADLDDDQIQAIKDGPT